VPLQTKPLLHVIDDHKEARESLQALLIAHGYRVHIYPNAEEFFAAYPQEPNGCVITDLKMYGIDGLQVVQMIKQHQKPMPVIVVSAFATVGEAVQIMKSGADTLIQKPYDDSEILQAVSESLQRIKAVNLRQTEISELNERFESLTSEELHVLERMTAGQPTKAIAYELDLSSRTVDRRRMSIFEKLQAKSLAELAMLFIEWTRLNSEQKFPRPE
jgi:two-component system response regulator FixJ